MFTRALLLNCLLFHAIAAPAQSQVAAMPPLEPKDGLDAGSARAAVLEGRILPLDQILDILRAGFEGEIIEIQLEYEDDELAYEFDLVSPEGRVFEVEIDARTGAIIEVEDEEDD